MAILALARALAHLPQACRPRTIEFAFPTAHFYQRVASPDLRHGGAGVLARGLDRGYDRGRVAAVVVLEHLGAPEERAVPRPGHPGRVLRPTGRPELTQVFATPSAHPARSRPPGRSCATASTAPRCSSARTDPTRTGPPSTATVGEGTP